MTITSASTSTHERQPNTRRRLVVCLDGTWANRDSGTNILHLANLIEEGHVGGGWIQKVYYDTGVGTGLLDRVAGGAFATGLSKNVCEAYDWLVEQFEWGHDTQPCDEIYVFGFSRGAFTARSLVGFISRCGLLRRGAPISLEELWNGYRVLGRYPPARIGDVPDDHWWNFKRRLPNRPFRARWELSREPWEEEADRRRVGIKEPKPPVSPSTFNRTERLLVEWSHRPPITCVGIFDTVASLGYDALTIPWIRDTAAQFHDTRLSSIVVNGFHALAVDEHRANFAHVPWLRELADGLDDDKTPCGGRIEQRWFTGAHSNIGGSYDDDRLAQFPLHWMIGCTQPLGLVFRETLAAPDVRDVVPVLAPEKPWLDVPHMETKKPWLRDSYAEFAAPLWQHLLRVKRSYRRIGPPPETLYGQPMRSINEHVDPSVLAIIGAPANSPRYAPPNVWEYCQRTGTERWPGAKPTHRYLTSFKAAAWLAFWTTFVGVGAHVVASWTVHGAGWPMRIAVATAIAAVLGDWTESLLNHKVTLEPRRLLAVLYGEFMTGLVAVRLVAIGLAAIGFVWLITFVVIWLLAHVFVHPSFIAKWLLVLGALFTALEASLAWTAAPMTDTGMGSIARLQAAKTVEQFRAYFASWMPRAEDAPDAQPFDLLRPIVRSLWIDVIFLIFLYGAVLFAGACSLFIPRGTSSGGELWTWFCEVAPWRWVLPAVGATMAADFVEDYMHLRFIAKRPVSPSNAAVRVAVAAFRIKRAGLVLLASATALAAGRLVYLHGWHVPSWAAAFGALLIARSFGRIARLFAEK